MSKNTATGAQAPAESAAISTAQPSSNKRLAAAIALARYGFSIFPLIPNDKRPLIENWQNLATNDERQVRDWWTRQPDANIGISTENLLVIDVDPRNGGDTTFRALFEQQHTLGEEFPPTLATRTRANGTHIFYGLPPHTVVRGGASRLGAGVDIKSHGGYVVGAGSAIDNKTYHWKSGYGPDEKDLKWAPQWLIERCNTAKPKTADAGKVIVAEDDAALQLATDYLRGQAPEAIQGGRDNTAYTVAARLYDFGVTRETCREMLEEWNESYCHPPLEPDELERVAWSAQRNRENAIGAKHPNAPGFEAVEVAPRTPIDVLASADNGEGRPRLYAITLDEASAEALNRIGDPLIDGLLDREAMSVWYGESNSGKTFVVLDAAFHVAAGRPWATMQTRKGVVVYVAAEGGGGIRKRFRAIRERYTDAGAAPLYLIPCPVDLLHPAADLKPLAAVVKGIEAKAGKVELVVIDTLSRAMPGGDGNSPKDMTSFVNNLDLLRRALKAHVAVVHHTGKDKLRGARGHSSLRAATDTEIEIGNRKLEVTKQRDMDGDLCIGFALRPMRLGASKAGREITSCTVEMCRPGEAAATPIVLQPALQDFLEEIESELLERCQGDTAAVYRTPFTTALAIECGAKIAPADARAHPPESKAMRDHINRMMREMRDKGHVKKVKRGQWLLLDARNAHDAQSQTSTQCADARGALAPRIAEDQSKPVVTGQNPTNLNGAAPPKRGLAESRVGA